MESIMLNNNQRSFVLESDMTDELTINQIILYDDSSFLSHSQSLSLKVFKDGVEALNKHISTYPLKDESGTIALINEKFTNYKELQIEIYEDNPLLNEEINFNLELEFSVNKPVSI